jgi:hypothetical protein
MTSLKSINGFKRSPTQTLLEMQTSIERYRFFNDKEMLILFAGHPSFYKFPIDSMQPSELKEYLDSRIKAATILNVKVDPISRQILSIEDKP